MRVNAIKPSRLYDGQSIFETIRNVVWFVMTFLFFWDRWKSMKPFHRASAILVGALILDVSAISVLMTAWILNNLNGSIWGIVMVIVPCFNYAFVSGAIMYKLGNYVLEQYRPLNASEVQRLSEFISYGGGKNVPLLFLVHVAQKLNAEAKFTS